jgi:hypothetical protein
VVSGRCCRLCSALLLAAPPRCRSQPLDDEVLMQLASLAELSVPKACCLDRGVASPSCAWAAWACMPVSAAWPHCPLPIQLTSSPPMYGQNPYWRHRHASPCRCPPSLRSMPARALSLSDRGRALCATPSFPITPSARAYKRRPHPWHLVCAIDLLSSPICQTPPPPPLFSIVTATMDNAAHCLSVSLCRSRRFAELQSRSLSHWTPTFPAGAPPHRCCTGKLPL